MASTLFGGVKPPVPIIGAPPPAAVGEDTAVKEAAAAEAKRLKKRRGAAGMIKTSPEGIMTKADVLKETLG